MSLDVYVKSYIPAWLQEVNAQSMGVAHLHLPVDTREQKPEQYIKTFSGSDVWQQLRQTRERPSEHHTPDELVDLKDHIASQRKFLVLENAARVTQAEGWSRYEIRLTPYQETFRPNGHGERFSHDGGRGPPTRLYQCEIRGLQEFTPNAFIGDPVRVRQLVPATQTFDGYVLHGKVAGTRRARNLAVLELPAIHMHTGIFNIVFPHNNAILARQDEILASLAHRASVGISQGGLPSFVSETTWWLSHTLPTTKDCKLKTQLTTIRQFNWSDTALNIEQMKAIQEIVEHRYGEVPYLIQGPPGTGKTKTVVEAILQILNADPDARVLASGPSNTAADTLAVRLSRNLNDPRLLIRLNSASRSFEEVPEILLPFSCIADDRFIMPKFGDLMRKRVIVGTTTEIMQLWAVKCDNKSLDRFEEYAMGNLQPENYSSRRKRPHFTHLFLDEAGQATEAETMCLMAVIEPEPDQKISIILAGDHQQLGPRVVSDEVRKSGLDQSLFEKLANRSCYAKHPLSRKNLLAHPRPKLPYITPMFSNLFRNYRSHPSILMVPSQLSYNASLAACAENVSTFVESSPQSTPVFFIGHNGRESTADIENMTSWYNQKEIDLIVAKIESLMGRADIEIKGEDIAVLAPFREQVVRLRRALRERHLSSVGVGSVEDYQGSEARVVIISIVRSEERFLENDRLNGVGLIHERRRTNVALTRAKELLIVVGNPVLMSRDESWSPWLAFCRRHGTVEVVGMDAGHDASANPGVLAASEIPLISSLEIAYHYQAGQGSVLGDGAARREPSLYSDDAMILAGHAAQLVLGDAEY